MKKGIIGPAIVILVGILTLITAVTGVLYYTKKLTLPSLSNPIAQNSYPTSQTASPTPTVDQVTKWETYTNQDYNFSIQYPAYLLNVRPQTTSSGYNISFSRNASSKNFVIVGIEKATGNFYSQLFSMTPGQKKEILVGGLWYERNSDISLSAGNAMFYDFETVVPDTLIKLGAPTVKYLDSKLSPGGKASLRGKSIYIVKNGLAYSINITLDVDGDPELENKFLTIIATFKFTN